jgi:hypothetical protein
VGVNESIGIEFLQTGGWQLGTATGAGSREPSIMVTCRHVWKLEENENIITVNGLHMPASRGVRTGSRNVQ